MNIFARSNQQLLRIDGYGDLTKYDVSLLNAFPKVWARFEQIFGDRFANANILCNAANDLLLHEWQEGLPYEQRKCFEYFADRYNDEDKLNALCTRNDGDLDGATHPRLHRIFDGDQRCDLHCLQANFLVVYRLRNNFLHGNKFEGRLRDQTLNFSMSLKSMLNALESR